MPGVTFSGLMVSNSDRPFPLEDVFRLYGAWSGIHQYKFDELLNTSATYTGAGSWASTTVLGSSPPNVHIKYNVSSASQGVSFTVGGDVYVIGTNSGVAVVIKNGTTVCSVPVFFSIPASCIASFQILNFSDENEYWRTLSLWINGKPMITFTDYSVSSTGIISIGLARHTGQVAYSNVIIPELCETAEYGSIDPGDYSYSGLQRAIEGRNIRFFIRFNGQLTARRMKPTTSKLSLSSGSGLTQYEKTFDVASLFTHVRMMGAYLWSESVNFQYMKTHGEKFTEISNPMLFSEEEIFVEAQKSLLRIEESAFTASAATYPTPLIELLDRITIDGESWTVMAVQTQYSGNGMSIQQFILGKYVWGDP